MYTPKQNKITTVLSKKNGKIFRYLKRTTSRKITIIPDKERLLKNLINKQFCKGPNYKPIGKPSWTLLDEYEIVLKYRRIIIGLSNYYRNCDSHRILHYVSYILQYSCAKTIARRKKKSLRSIFKQYGKNLTIQKNIQTLKKNKPITVNFS